MKILYIANKPAVPVVDGGTLAMKQFIDVLSTEYTCDAFVLSTHKHPFSKESNTFFSSKFETVYNEEINTKINPLKLIFQSILGKSYVLNRFSSKKLKSILTRSNYDLVVCDSLFALYPYLKSSDRKSKIWLRSHNVEFNVWATRANQNSGFKKWLFNRQAAVLKSIEIELISKIDVNFCVSEDDINIFKYYLPKVKHVNLPINIEQKAISPLNKECYFLGSNNWHPNIETVEYLIKIWGSLAFQQHKLTIGGGFEETQLTTNTNPAVQFVGKLENVEEFAAHNGILVAPTFSGSGIRVKILEAMSIGIPTITTALGAQGISEEAGLIIVDNETELLKEIELLKMNQDYYNSKSSLAKQYILKYHSFEAVKSKLKQVFGE